MPISSRPPLRVAAGALVLVPALVLLPGLCRAQHAVSAASPPLATEVAFEQRYADLQHLALVPGRVAEVNGLVLRRDVATFNFEQGRFYLLSPIAGRTIGLVYRGKGTFSFTPPPGIERARVQRFYKRPTLAQPFSDVVFLFADSTLLEVERQVSFGPGEPPGDLRSPVRSMLDYLGDNRSRSFDVDIMSAVLNGENSDLFYAHVTPSGGDPLMFMLAPQRNEAVRLSGRLRRAGWLRESEVVSQFARQGDTVRATTYERRPQATTRDFAIESWLDQTGAGDVGFRAIATFKIDAASTVGPWVAFHLFEELQADSARWAGGERAVVFKGKRSPTLWVNLGRALPAGDSRTLTLFYHGDLIDRFGDWFYIKSAAAWYPVALEGRSRARFDLTYHTSAAFVLASVGDSMGSSRDGRRVTTRWVTPGPVQFAAFNLGRYKEQRIQEQGLPPITVLAADDAHKVFAQELHRRGMTEFGRQRNMKAVVGNDVLNSIKFFRHAFGEPPVKHIYVTEVPYFHGLAFPGLVHLSWTTFHQTQDDGFDEFFRAHEVAHQWWGIGVDYTTYHDQWLSEGFASFAGLWYLQTVRKDNPRYFRMLDRWRADILARRSEPDPVWLGWRNTTGLDERGYSVIVYQKGAWALHMLRILMLDLKTMNEDRFTETMRDFYRTHQGERASTEDFRRTVESHMGMDMGWFFDQWVYGTEIPAYTVSHRTRSAEKGQFRVTMRVEQAGVSDSFQMWVPVTLDLGANRAVRLRVKVRGPHTEIDLPLVPSQPRAVRFNDLDGVLADVKEVGWRD